MLSFEMTQRESGFYTMIAFYSIDIVSLCIMRFELLNRDIVSLCIMRLELLNRDIVCTGPTEWAG